MKNSKLTKQIIKYSKHPEKILELCYPLLTGQRFSIRRGEKLGSYVDRTGKIKQRPGRYYAIFMLSYDQPDDKFSMGSCCSPQWIELPNSFLYKTKKEGNEFLKRLVTIGARVIGGAVIEDNVGIGFVKTS